MTNLMRAAAFMLLAAAAPALADGDTVVTTTEAPVFELHVTRDNSLVKPWPKTAEECDARARASLGEWTCVTRVKYKTAGACSPTPPAIAVLLDTEGFLVLPRLVVEAQADGSWGPTMEEGYLPTPKPYPECWVRGLVPYTGEWHAPEGPPVNEPTGWPPTP
jgi:hypothetical protein